MFQFAFFTYVDLFLGEKLNNTIIMLCHQPICMHFSVLILEMCVTFRSGGDKRLVIRKSDVLRLVVSSQTIALLCET